jgi:hypothetical protein
VIQPPHSFGYHDTGRDFRGCLQNKGDFAPFVEGDDCLAIFEVFGLGIRRVHEEKHSLLFLAEIFPLPKRRVQSIEAGGRHQSKRKIAGVRGNIKG